MAPSKKKQQGKKTEKKATATLKPIPIFDPVPYTFHANVPDPVGDNGYKFKSRSWFEQVQYEDLDLKTQKKLKNEAADPQVKAKYNAARNAEKKQKLQELKEQKEQKEQKCKADDKAEKVAKKEEKEEGKKEVEGQQKQPAAVASEEENTRDAPSSQSKAQEGKAGKDANDTLTPPVNAKKAKRRAKEKAKKALRAKETQQETSSKEENTCEINSIKATPEFTNLALRPAPPLTPPTTPSSTTKASEAKGDAIPTMDLEKA